ncbi:hypothetical protein GGI09_002228 [Coemansia sp. S100]|nr:hypothetical protein GGI16_005290 [Coemansia sp. S142-1]KAJ2100535.1 hypothetical protein GGI09_002228 [Coemansia sp. S100]
MSMADSERGSPSPTPSSAKPARTGRGAKPHVPSACTNCKKAHLACDLQRPCRRCVGAGKCDTCKDVQHKKRGRPRSKDKKSMAGVASSMQTQMFQFSLPAMPLPPPVSSAWRLAAESAVLVPTSHLFLTPDLRCLRLEEGSGRLLLGYSLLSLINRSVSDFVSDCDQHAVLAAFAAVRQQLTMRLGPVPEYSNAHSGQSPRAIDPNVFQTQPIDRLLQRAPVDVYSDVRAHLRTASGAYGLFNIHIYAGSCGALTMADIYYVCRITRFDALDACPTPPYASLPPLGCAMAEPIAELGHPYKRQYASPPRRTPDALYMLAAVTDTDSRETASLASSSWSSKLSTVSSSPTLTASMPRSATLPSLSELLKSLDTNLGPRIWSPTLDNGHCTSP